MFNRFSNRSQLNYQRVISLQVYAAGSQTSLSQLFPSLRALGSKRREFSYFLEKKVTLLAVFLRVMGWKF